MYLNMFPPAAGKVHTDSATSRKRMDFEAHSSFLNVSTIFIIFSNEVLFQRGPGNERPYNLRPTLTVKMRRSENQINNLIAEGRL